jgi:sugar phosphate isomerase/epimerase
MMLSIDTGYARAEGSPQPYLCQIADAGFTHVHWVHHWNGDFIYSSAEIEQISAWLRAFGLQLLDLHAPDGVEKSWSSVREYERLAGVEMVRNRIDMTARLGGDAIVMHLLHLSEPSLGEQRWAQVRKSLDELEPHARRQGVRIALENTSDGSVAHIEQLFELYGREYLGLCYDSGHGNMSGNGLDQLERLKDRLIVIHLHDNDGTADQHKLPFTGTVDWPRLAGLLAASSYRKCVSMESNMNHFGSKDEMDFLRQAHAAGTRLTEMIER